MARNRSGKTFKFNLLSPKTQEEVALETERDDSTAYAVLLVFFAVFIYACLIAVQLFFTRPQLSQAEQTLAQRNLQLATYSDLLEKHGELYVKTLILDPLLDKDLNTADIFGMADQIRKIDGRLGIVSYEREAEGILVYEVLSPTMDVTPNMIRTIAALETVKNVQIRSIETGSETNIVKIIVAIELKPTITTV